MRCQYCDTEYAFHEGKKISIEHILEQVASYKPKYITVTGGEPLAQPNCHLLLSELCDQGYDVALETSGSMDIEKVDSRVSVVMDLKTPDSAEVNKNRYENIAYLKQKDQLKFVLCSRQDYDWAKFTLDQYGLVDKVGEVLFSSSFNQLNPSDLADWIVADNLPVRFQLQLHKLLWNDEPGR